jgi:hypothetical protein
METRMYGLVNYQLSGIQKGIQFLHGVIEYSIIVEKIGGQELEKYKKWANKDKTIIILNGGTTSYNKISDSYFGTLNNYMKELDSNNIINSSFNEPDLGDQLTAVVFLVDERVFNKEKYPDFTKWLSEIDKDIDILKFMFDEEKIIDEYPEEYNEWLDLIGGEKNKFLREFLKKFNLA